MMDAGRLRERVTVQSPTEASNTLGETVVTWNTLTEVYASVEGVTAREALIAGQQEVTITHKVTMRYLPALTHQMRFVWRGRTLQIISLLEHENRSVHEAICTEAR